MARRAEGAEGRGRGATGVGADVSAGVDVDWVTFSECGPLGGVMGSWTAVSGLPAAPGSAPLPLAISIKICSYHLIKNIPFMIRYRPACNRGR